MHSDFDIIENNDDFLVINKHNNVDFHCSDSGLGIVAKVSQALGNSTLYPVHRLDKMTSGLLIMAKSSQVAAQFGVLFESRTIRKFYLALSDKKPKKKQGLIKGDMKKGRNGSYLLLKSNDNPAVTQFFSFSVAAGIRGFVLKPHTGKTHQLRVAMKSIGAPILGDPRYYPQHQGDVGFLHAWQLQFELNGQAFAFTAQPPWTLNGVEAWLRDMTKPQELSWPKL